MLIINNNISALDILGSLIQLSAALKGLEIMLNVTFSIDNSKLKIIERLQYRIIHIKLHYIVEKPTMIELEAINEDPDADLMELETAEESEDDITGV